MTQAKVLYVREETSTGVRFDHAPLELIQDAAGVRAGNAPRQLAGLPALLQPLAHMMPFYFLTPPDWLRLDYTRTLRGRDLGLAQVRVAYAHTLLASEMFRVGHPFSHGDAYRDARAHGKYGTKKGYAAARSLHKLKLAKDFNLYRVVNGRRHYLTTTAAHKPFGEFWLALGEFFGWPLEWGGAKGRADGNHYSYGFDGQW